MRKKEAVSGWRLAVSSDSNRASRTHALRSSIFIATLTAMVNAIFLTIR